VRSFFSTGAERSTAEAGPLPPFPLPLEWVYFARPDSFIDNVNVYLLPGRARTAPGEEVRKQNLEIDVVVPVPDSARDAAIEIARGLNLKYREALVKNRYIGRTSSCPPRTSGGARCA